MSTTATWSKSTQRQVRQLAPSLFQMKVMARHAQEPDGPPQVDFILTPQRLTKASEISDGTTSKLTLTCHPTKAEGMASLIIFFCHPKDVPLQWVG